MSRPLRFVLRHGAAAAARIRAACVGASGVQLGAGVQIGAATEVALLGKAARCGQIILGDRTRIDRGALLHPYGGTIETGIDVYIGPYTAIYGHGGVTIGKDTLISMHCRVLSSNHALPPIGTIIRSMGDVLRPTKIGADVWIGTGVTILGGVTIGDGAVIGGGAVVTKDIAAGWIAHGVPARAIRRR